ncbi:MAG: hypothetical protein HN341_05180 [Verrucomicrobia bacterium]|jgi:outer membrane protein assembly factor BamB|nr:hypothetical protein [Verrucomicrobiota bacterium]
MNGRLLALLSKGYIQVVLLSVAILAGCMASPSSDPAPPMHGTQAWSSEGKQRSMDGSIAVLAHAILFVTDGNVCVSNKARNVMRLTSSGKDHSPVLSPDGRSVAFLRKSSNVAYLPASGEADGDGNRLLADQVWMVDLGTGKEMLLVADRMPGEGDVTEELKKTVGVVSALCFSPDSRNLYFTTWAWVVSGALHAVDLRTGTERFVTDANSVEVVQSGDHAGCLIVRKHKYFLGGGSYDWYWLIDSQGREIGLIGEVEGQVDMFKEMN